MRSVCSLRHYIQRHWRPPGTHCCPHVFCARPSISRRCQSVISAARPSYKRQRRGRLSLHPGRNGADVQLTTLERRLPFSGPAPLAEITQRGILQRSSHHSEVESVRRLPRRPDLAPPSAAMQTSSLSGTDVALLGRVSRSVWQMHLSWPMGGNGKRSRRRPVLLATPDVPAGFTAHHGRRGRRNT